MYIYCITNLINGKIYIGQHAGDDLEEYLKHNIRHALAGIGNKTYLYRAIKKQNGEGFEIRPLIKLYTTDKEFARQQLDRLEIFFIRTLESRSSDIGYNITAGGGGQLGQSRTLTEEHKNKIAQAMRGRVITWADKISAAQAGRPLAEEHKQKLRGKRNKHKTPRSLEHSQIISENKKKWWAERNINGTPRKRRKSA